MNIRIFSNGASNGAVALSNYLRDLGLKSTKVSFTSKELSLRKSDLLINWGSSSYPKWINRKDITITSGILNMPEYVSTAISKIETFKELAAIGVTIPEFALSSGDVAEEWGQVVCRSLTRASAGKGIDIVTYKDMFNLGRTYPLYVQYIKKTKEFRVHVFNGGIIDVQEKRAIKNFEGTIDYKVRSHERGWAFCRDGIDVPPPVFEVAVDAVDALNLDFGAVDIIWNRHHKKAYVLEINTAPGLEGTTVASYGEAISNYINSLGD